MFLIALSLCNSKTLAQIKSNSMSIRRRMVLLSPIPISAVLLKYYLMSTYCVPGIELYTENSTIRQRRSLPSQIPWLWQYKLIVCTCPWIDSVYNFRKFKCLRTSRASSLNANGWGEAGRADWFFFLSLNIKVHIFWVKEKKNYSSLWHLCQAGWWVILFMWVCFFLVFLFLFLAFCSSAFSCSGVLVHFPRWRKFWRWMLFVYGRTTMWTHLMPQNCTFKNG